MKRLFLAGMTALLTFFLAGCGGGGSSAPPPIITTQILSDSTLNGDIVQDPVSGAFTVTQGNIQSAFAGVDPVTGDEFRAFLDFPLFGPDGVPVNAVINSAVLDIFIDDIRLQSLLTEIPIRIDLVSFQPPTLVETDFIVAIQPALATTFISPPISQADFGEHVLVNVTSLMREAQRLALSNFQVRILLDLAAVTPGLIEINDTTGVNRAFLAPLLRVEYF